ncbi:Unknown protein sequence [Pseudomonas syringae pv. maculicola str. M6]|nr:Unknown protein sequence [Pseudomonas syringae pv. maculicola str. M6]
MQQPCARPTFHLRQIAGDHRSGHIQRFGGSDEAAAFVDGDEHPSRRDAIHYSSDSSNL